MTSNLPFDWTEIFGSERLTGAFLDRLTHHVHILDMNGESYRLNQTKTAEIPKNTCLTAGAMVDPVGPQEPPTYVLPGQPHDTAYRITLSGLVLLRPGGLILLRR